MNNKKICFITCFNNSTYVAEQMKYMKCLNVPSGYEIEVLGIEEALSMTSGYNEGMQASDAKYKVYLHQDVFIVEPDFIHYILDIFEDNTIGMIGVVGAPKLPENAIMWNGNRVGKIYFNMIYESGESDIGQIESKCQEVEAVDGLLMVTQYDIAWREDLFRDWDFYDVSQSQEFIKKGYKVVVPKQEHAWCIHDDGFFNLKNYYKNRRIFIKEYKNLKCHNKKKK